MNNVFIKSLDINKTLNTFISTDLVNPPCQPRATTCNSLREIEICLFVKSPLIKVRMCANGSKQRKYFK